MRNVGERRRGKKQRPASKLASVQRDARIYVIGSDAMRGGGCCGNGQYYGAAEEPDRVRVRERERERSIRPQERK